MKDFSKIFLGLCALVGVFVFGQKKGEESFKQSEEYQILMRQKEEQAFTKSDLENAKTKFQNILDGAETKKSEELLAQILQVFLADLGLRIQNQKSFTKENTVVVPAAPPPAKEPLHQAQQTAHASSPPKEKVFDYKRLKSYEWILQNATNESDLKRNLKNVEIKDIDSFLKNSVEAKPQQIESFFGSYRGRIIDIDRKEYGTLVLEINPVADAAPAKLKGSIKIFKNGRETSARNFTTTQLGYLVEGSSCLILENGGTYFQVYKISETQQITGFYYERLVNGTTKTIGSFLLNRVDQF